MTSDSRSRGGAGVLADVAPEVGVNKPDPVLTVDGVRRVFGGLTAVDVEHLEMQRGCITGLIGPNGAGKTTMFNLLTGFDMPDGGSWVFDGTDITRLSAHNIARLGMVRTFQLTKALSKMTVIDNMRLGATGQTGERFLFAFVKALWGDEESDNTERAEELLERFNLSRMRDEYAATLSGGQRKLLEMARALMVSPSMIMLDEPMAGVNPALKQSLLHHVTSLTDDGCSVVFIEHDMDVIMNISDWVICMAQGQIIAEGPPSSISRNPDVIDAYLGRQHGEQAVATEEPSGDHTIDADEGRQAKRNDGGRSGGSR